MTTSDKRQRHKEGHRNRVEEARLAAAKARRTRTLIVVGVAVVAVIAVAVAASVTSKDDKTDVTAGASTTTAPALTGTSVTTASTPSTPTVSVPSPAAGATITGTTACPPADGSAERTTTFAKAPPTCIDPAKTYTAEMTTSEGAITIALDPKQSPIAVNNFVVLSRYHFYDGDPFHRIVPGFVDQAGSFGPNLGSGGPGYDLPKEKPTRTYAKGDLAMAASSDGTPSGSQFFLTIDATALNASPNYPILGTVTKGQDVVEKINQFGDQASDGAPTKVVTIQTVTITES